ncbi:hypothetical protein KR018_003628, partial [Drosophila ironensis]
GSGVNAGVSHNGMQQHGVGGSMLHQQHNSNSSLLLDHSDLGLGGSVSVSVAGGGNPDEGNHNSLEDSNKSPLDANSTPLANSNDNDDEDVID